MRMTKRDKHNLMDAFYMDFDIETLKLNKLLDWYNDFFNRLDEYCCPELSSSIKSTNNHTQETIKRDNLGEESEMGDTIIHAASVKTPETHIVNKANEVRDES